MTKKLLISFVLLFSTLVQGCVFQSNFQQNATHQLAQNRVDLLRYDTVSDLDVELLDSYVKDNLIQLTIRMPSLEGFQMKSLSNRVLNAYCAQKETRRLLDSGVRYHLSVLDKESRHISSFYIDGNQCPS